MTHSIKFLDTVIRNLPAQSKRQTFWCYGCPGFGLRINPSGSKVFIFKYMSGVQKIKSRWVSIGKYPEWSIHKARQEYDRLYILVHEYGRDPVEEIKLEKEKLEEQISVAEFVNVYIELGKQKGKKSIQEELRIFRLDVIPVIGEKLLHEVTVDDIEKIQTRILIRAQQTPNATRNGKVVLKNTLAHTRQLFNLAKKKRLIENNPVTEIESLGTSGSRDRVLTFEEIWKFWHHIDKTGISPITANALKFNLVTMQRSIEVRNMTFAGLKIDEGVWQMETHETKNKTMHRVPLNGYALKIIEDASKFTGRSQYIFGATRAQTPPATLNPKLKPLSKFALPQAIRRNRDIFEIDNFCPHDLRRTGATWITAVGLPKLYAKLMLNHSDGERDITGEVYVQYSYDFEKKKAMQVWEFILDQVTSCTNKDDIPTLDQLRTDIKNSGLI